MKKIISILLCIVFVFCLTSCQNESEDTEPTEPSTKEDTFVADFQNELKKDPYQYIDKQVSLRGTVIKYETEIRLVDVSDNRLKSLGTGAMLRYEFDLINASIVAVISDEIKLAALDSGDYVEINGVLKMKDGKFYFDNCDYTMIKTFKERKNS